MPLQPTPKGSSHGLGPSTDGVPQLSPVPRIQSDLRLPELLVPALASGTSVAMASHVGAHGDVRSPHLHRFSQPTPNKRTQSKKTIVTCFLGDKCRVRTRPAAPLQTGMPLLNLSAVHIWQLSKEPDPRTLAPAGPIPGTGCLRRPACYRTSLALMSHGSCQGPHDHLSYTL